MIGRSGTRTFPAPRRLLPTTIPLGLVLLALGTTPGCRWAAPFRGAVFEPPVPAAGFTLLDQQRRPFRLVDQRGNAVLLYFGYTFCPDVCPTTLGIWRKVDTALGDLAHGVRFVMITVDPERDTPDRLRMYLSVFSPRFIGLTGSEQALAAVYRAYGVVREKEIAPGSAAGYLVSHTARVFLIDPAGTLRTSYSYDAPVEDLIHDIRRLLH